MALGFAVRYSEDISGQETHVVCALGTSLEANDGVRGSRKVVVYRAVNVLQRSQTERGSRQPSLRLVMCGKTRDRTM